MKIKSLRWETFCQLLFVAYKEIYWILPSIVFLGVWWPKNITEIYFSTNVCDHVCVPKLDQPINKFSFIHLLIHLKNVYWPLSMHQAWGYKKEQDIVCVVEKFTVVCAVLWEFRERSTLFVLKQLERISWRSEDLKSLCLYLQNKTKLLLILIIANSSFKANNTESIVLTCLPPVYSLTHCD